MQTHDISSNIDCENVFMRARQEIHNTGCKLCGLSTWLMFLVVDCRTLLDRNNIEFELVINC